MGTPERRKKRERSASVGSPLDAVPSPARNHKKSDTPDDEHAAYLESYRRAEETPAMPERLDGTARNANFLVPPQLSRRRSSSCGVIASMLRGGFSTIPEEDFEDVADSDECSGRESFERYEGDEEVRQSEERSDELPTLVLGTRAAGGPTFVQDAPPPLSW
jgi:hypothetical protein